MANFGKKSVKKVVRKKQPVKKVVRKKQTVKKVVPKQQQVKKVVPKQQQVKKVVPKQEPVKKVVPKQEPVKKVVSKQCSYNLINLFYDLENEPYNLDNFANFKTKVKFLEKYIKNAKIEAGIKVSEVHTDEKRIKRLAIMLKQLPDKPCMIDQSSISIVSDENGVKLLNNNENYYNEIFSICKNVLKHNRIIIPVGIKKYIRNKIIYHANLIIVDLDTREAWRIEPNKVRKKNEERYKKVLTDFFNPIGISFQGFYPESCPIKHADLCRYVSYAQYIYGSAIDHDKVKNVILQFLYDDIQELCSFN